MYDSIGMLFNDRYFCNIVYNNNNNICLKSNIQTSSVDCAPRELTHACSRSDTCSRSFVPKFKVHELCFGG